MAGAGESGKSTILKQMRLIYTEGFGLHERKEVRQVIFANMIVAFKIIGEEMRDLGMSYELEKSPVRSSRMKRVHVSNSSGLEVRRDPVTCRRYRHRRLVPVRLSTSDESALGRSSSADDHTARKRICIA
jgi:hypothetical protein